MLFKMNRPAIKVAITAGFLLIATAIRAAGPSTESKAPLASPIQRDIAAKWPEITHHFFDFHNAAPELASIIEVVRYATPDNINNPAFLIDFAPVLHEFHNVAKEFIMVGVLKPTDIASLDSSTLFAERTRLQLLNHPVVRKLLLPYITENETQELKDIEMSYYWALPEKLRNAGVTTANQLNPPLSPLLREIFKNKEICTPIVITDDREYRERHPSLRGRSYRTADDIEFFKSFKELEVLNRNDLQSAKDRGQRREERNQRWGVEFNHSVVIKMNSGTEIEGKYLGVMNGDPVIQLMDADYTDLYFKVNEREISKLKVKAYGLRGLDNLQPGEHVTLHAQILHKGRTHFIKVSGTVAKLEAGDVVVNVESQSEIDGLGEPARKIGDVSFESPRFAFPRQSIGHWERDAVPR